MSDEPKGLKFYLCQTPEGPQYVHLQADAKKIDPNYETVYVDTSKQALMDRLNHLMRSPVQGISLAEGDEPPAPRPAAKPGEIGTFAEGNRPAGDNKWHGDDHLVYAGEACNVCMTRKAISGWRASTEASIAVEEVIGSIREPIHLANIREMIDDRSKQLAEQGVAPVEATANRPIPKPKKKAWGKK
jgi:hypothetical protein